MEKRLHNMDKLKCLCAILVVLLHTNSAIKDVILPLTRIAVPCFFMISGYLLFNPNSNDIGKYRLKRVTKNVLQIIFFASLPFFIYKEIQTYYSTDNIFLPSVNEIANMLLFCDNPFAYHLWYIHAYLYVVLFLLLFERYHIWNRIFKAIPMLLICNLLLEQADILYVRNFLFMGLPFFALGAYIKKIIQQNNNVCQGKFILLAGILFGVLSVVEEYFIVYKLALHKQEMYVSTIFLVICVFLYFVLKVNNSENMFALLGERYSLWIYVLHPLLIWNIASVVKRANSNTLSNLYFYISPIVVFGATFSLSFLMLKILRIKNYGKD